jgi:hypothetical protein
MSADHDRLSEEELASCASVFAGYEPTGDVDGAICAACNSSVDVHDDHEWTDGDICDSCAAAECATLLKAGRKLLAHEAALKAELVAAKTTISELQWGSKYVAGRNAALVEAECNELAESIRKYSDAPTKWYRRRIAGALVAMARLDGESAHAQLRDALKHSPTNEAVDRLVAELATALVDAEKWREQERERAERDDAAERGGDW